MSVSITIKIITIVGNNQQGVSVSEFGSGANWNGVFVVDLRLINLKLGHLGLIRFGINKKPHHEN